MDIRQHATSNYMHRGPPRPRRPMAFVQPCPMGVTPLNQALSVLSLSRQLSLISISLPYIHKLHVCVLCCLLWPFLCCLVSVCMCSVSWLFCLNCQYLPSDWLKKTPLRTPNRGTEIISTKRKPKSTYVLYRFSAVLFHCIIVCLFVLSPGPTRYIQGCRGYELSYPYRYQ